MLSKKKGNPYFSFFVYFVPNTVGIWIKKKDYRDSTMCAWKNCEGQCKADQTVHVRTMHIKIWWINWMNLTMLSNSSSLEATDLPEEQIFIERTTPFNWKETTLLAGYNILVTLQSLPKLYFDFWYEIELFLVILEYLSQINYFIYITLIMW